MSSNDFSYGRFANANQSEREQLSAKLQEHLQASLQRRLEEVFVDAVAEFADHGLVKELPWTSGEFGFVDPTGGHDGLRVCFDVVISVGFADRSSETEIAP